MIPCMPVHLGMVLAQLVTNQGFKSLICSKNVYNEFLYYLLQQIKPQIVEISI